MSATETKHDLATLEAVIEEHERSYIAVGTALRTIRDEELYRELGYEDFDSYVHERWSFGAYTAQRYIRVAVFVEAHPETQLFGLRFSHFVACIHAASAFDMEALSLLHRAAEEKLSVRDIMRIAWEESHHGHEYQPREPWVGKGLWGQVWDLDHGLFDDAPAHVLQEMHDNAERIVAGTQRLLDRKSTA